ncbi:unnamed protein product [Effrenium voratum]|uniref:Uncharacterized protein n=1 Tax=Effrenium voratum TaxID=2562239 RepID=A0AA36NCJ6_9DINO|nr:unnamed protein product [Effrenium voratum]CAJ1425587.1 unnamed protein product [Effrenium voratum]
MTRPAHFCLVLLLVWQLKVGCQWAFTNCPAQLGIPRRLAGRTVRQVRERRQASPRPRPKQRGTGEDEHTPPRVITSRVRNAASAAEVLTVMQSEQENPELNLISVSAAWCRLAQLQHSINAEVADSLTFRMFVRLTQSLMAKPEARTVANTLWATARLQVRAAPQLATLWTSLASAINATVSDMREQHIANSIWAVAKIATSNHGSEALLKSMPLLASRVPTVISKMTSQAVANVIWATGQLSDDPGHAAKSQCLREVLPIAVSHACTVLPVATMQEVANSCWGLALCDYHDTTFLEAVAARVSNEATGWSMSSAQLDLPSLLFAFARLKAEGHDDMLGVAAEKLTPMLFRIHDWYLCATTWSYQQLDRGDNFLAFRQHLEEEVRRRQLSEEDVERSRLGPDAW